jgi:hypothetical protein
MDFSIYRFHQNKSQHFKESRQSSFRMHNNVLIAEGNIFIPDLDYTQTIFTPKPTKAEQIDCRSMCKKDGRYDKCA